MAAVEAAFSSQDHFSGGLPSVTLPMMEARPPPHRPASTPPSPGDRPASALARGVQITEYKESKVNPDPVPLEETDYLLEEHLSARKLRDLTGEDDLDKVKYLELTVNTQETSLGNFGAHLPNLTQLKLSNSIITSVRDLGSSLDQLSVLWMARCGLEDIDGVASMNHLTELYLAYNEIDDVSPCSMLESLTILDLEGNNIDDISQVEFLALCPSLTNLTLEGNPVCVTPSVDEASADYDYRQAVSSRLPQLRLLDDEPLTKETTSPRRSASAFDDDWRLIEELMEDGTLAGAAEENISNIGRPGSAIRPATGYRPGSALKQRVATGQRPTTSSRLRPGTSARPPSGGRPPSGRPGSARPGSARPGSASKAGVEEEAPMEDASDLTLGGVVCGNPSKALKSRQRHLLGDDDNEKLNKLFEQHSNNPHAQRLDEPKRAPPMKEDENQLKELMVELQEWKQVHQERQKELDAEKAPQILRIDHDDAISVSSDGESVDSDLDDDLGPSSSSGVPRPPPRGYPLPPQSQGPRPRSGAGFSNSTSRRYQLSSRPTYDEPTADRPETPSARRRRLQYDDSFDAREDAGSPTGPASPELRLGTTGRSMQGSLILRASEEEPRLGSAATLRSGKLRLNPVIDKNQPKMINPLMRGSLSSPEHRSPDGSRSGSSGSPTNSGGSGRSGLRGQLGRVPLLPSKMGSKFK